MREVRSFTYMRYTQYFWVHTCERPTCRHATSSLDSEYAIVAKKWWCQRWFLLELTARLVGSGMEKDPDFRSRKKTCTRSERHRHSEIAILAYKFLEGLIPSTSNVVVLKPPISLALTDRKSCYNHWFVSCFSIASFPGPLLERLLLTIFDPHGLR